mgnify:CR=1 FL=1
MIQLHHDYLLIQTSTGETIPCSAELVANELIGSAASLIDPALVRQAAAAVVHYFKHDLARTAVWIADFSIALERVLRTLGLDVRTSDPHEEDGVSVSDLRNLVTESEVALELAFFPELRNQLRTQLTASPDLLRFEGLRGCVKHLLGARRWSRRCQNLNDQIVEFIRHCLRRDGKTDTCELMIR